jgi:predicted ATPase
MTKIGTSGSRDALRAITAVSVEGFKSIDSAKSIELRPLTILAGANSSGKSSMMQPLMLLKQTLESPYDPGPLLLNGANAKFTEVNQFLCKITKGERNRFAFGLSCDEETVKTTCRIHFQAKKDPPVELDHLIVQRHEHTHRFESGEVDFSTSPHRDLLPKGFPNALFGEGKSVLRLSRNRCFYEAEVVWTRGADERQVAVLNFDFPIFERAITHIIHVPGLRGNPKRNYPVTAVGERFVGTFEDYVASVIASAQSQGDDEFLDQIGNDLRELSLTWKVRAERVDATQVELRVGRLPQSKSGGSKDLVSVADVGFGVSQTLPVVVALVAAKPNQLVYIEQPEIHLHPRAQRALAGLLARAANRGVRVVVETHSAILLLGIQALVAEEKLDPASVILHWFSRGDDGITSIHTGQLDEAGRFGDWPVDFGDVSLQAESEFLDAAEAKLAQGTK